MQQTSELYKTLLEDPGHRKEYKAIIAGKEYGQDQIVSLETSGGLFEQESVCVGSAVSRQTELVLRAADDIPPGAEIRLWYRLKLGDRASEWIPRGKFYINSRERDRATEVLTLRCFDPLFDAEKPWEPDQSMEFPMPMPDVARELAKLIGLKLDERTELNPAYTIDYPTSDPESETGDYYTIRQELRWIAAAHGGNWTVTEAGKLRLVRLRDPASEANGEAFVGREAEGVQTPLALDPVSKIVILLDDNNYLEAGDDTGQTLELSCPFGTQQMADNLLAELGGFVYQPFQAQDALIDPAVELGDGVTVDGIHSMVAEMTTAFDGLMASDIGAPGQRENEGEFGGYIGPMTRAFNRKLAQTRAEITRTAEQIRQEVMSEVDDLSSSITVELQSITEQVNGLDDAYAALHLEVSGITSKVSGLDGQFTLLEQTVKAFTYTGPDGKVMISNGNISLTGSITWSDLTADVQNRVGGVTEEIVHTLISEDLVESPTIRGANIYGGTFWDDKEVGQLVLSYDLFGYRQVPSLIFMRRDGTELFGAYDADIGTTITGLNGHAAMLIDSNVTYPKGKWNYENATVIGPKFSQVSRLTSDHTEFYIYVVFSGVGLYTPVYAAAMSRTYTFVGSSPNRSTDYPIYGMTISINGSGTVSVSNIYAIYPADVHRNAIDFSADSVTIYAR